MDPTETVIWIFLGVFVLTALIALAGLVGWVRLEPYYKKNLFRLLILEVVGCVIGFGAGAFRSFNTPRMDLRTTLLRPELGWDWQYAQKGWRGRLHFKDAGGRRLVMTGSMRFVGPRAETLGAEDSILTWESSAPFDVPARATAVSFNATRTWTDAAVKVYPELRWEVGKKTAVVMTVRLDEALRGAAISETPQQTWTLMMTPGFP